MSRFILANKQYLKIEQVLMSKNSTFLLFNLFFPFGLKSKYFLFINLNYQIQSYLLNNLINISQIEFLMNLQNFANILSGTKQTLQNPQIQSPTFKRPNNSKSQTQLMTVITEAIGLLIDQKISKEPMNSKMERNRQEGIIYITISNKTNLSKSKYGESYKQQLDARDQIIAHPFDFDLEIDLRSKNIKENQNAKLLKFVHTKAYLELCDFITQFLVDVVQNVISISFNLLVSGKLKQNQSKDYACKNILLNVHSVLREVMETLLNQKIISDQQEGRRISNSLAELVDHTLNQSLNNLSSYYPQAPPTGGTARMREVLLSIDRNLNQEFDFLFTQNLKVKRQEDGDYTEFIMQVVNRAVQVTGDIDQKDPLQQTLFQKFVAFSQNLFWLCQQDSYSKILNNKNGNQTESVQKVIDQINKQKFNQIFQQIVKMESTQYKQIETQIQTEDAYCNFFSNPNPQYIKDPIISDQTKNVDNKQFITSYLKKPIFDSHKDVPSFLPEQKKQSKIQQMRKNHDFLIGQKLPPSVKSFTKKQIKDKNFTAKNSSVLRMLTKWAQNLQNIFENPDAFTINRNTPFKTVNHQIVYPKLKIKQMLKYKIQMMREQKNKIKEEIITKNTAFQGAFFWKTSNKNTTKYIKRYTQTRIMASKMNGLLIQYMKEYISKLIELLLEIGQIEVQMRQNHPEMKKHKYQINLVIFRIGDLMRSKTHCSQATFIRILKTLYILQEKDNSRRPLFKLVRIKNKLDSQDNNILINYLFMGKMQCELQVSVQKIQGKQQHYYSFAHFLYELTRGKLGVLSQCATIISQHDPVVSQSTSQHYYQPKKPKKLSKQQQKQKAKRQDYAFPLQNHRKQYTKTFICNICNGLKIQENMKLLIRSENQQQICNECLLDKFNKAEEKRMIRTVTTFFFDNIANSLDFSKNQKAPLQNQSALIESILGDSSISPSLIRSLDNGTLIKVHRYSDIAKKQKKEKDFSVQFPLLFLSINHKDNQIQFYILDYQQGEMIYYISRVSQQLWRTKQVTQDDIQLQFIKSSINDVRFPQFTYYLDQNKADILEVLNKMKIFSYQLSYNKIIQIWKKGVQKILTNSIRNSLKNKSQILNFSRNKAKFQFFNNFIIQSLQETKEQRWMIDNLPNVQNIFAQKIQLTQLPSWIKQVVSLKTLNLSSNLLTNINALKNCKELKVLDLSNNNILSTTNYDRFSKLQRLDLFQNKLQKFDVNYIPNSLLNLDLGYNYLKDLNLKNLSYSSSLKRLDLYHNKLSFLNLKKVPQTLQYLNLASNSLEALDVQRFPMNLITLQLTDNKLTNIELVDLPNLKQCLVSNNKLKRLIITKCSSLQTIEANNNNLQQFQLNEIPSLISLSLINKDLRYLKLKNLPKLQNIYLMSCNKKDYITFILQNINNCQNNLQNETDWKNLQQTKFNFLRKTKQKSRIQQQEILNSEI